MNAAELISSPTVSSNMGLVLLKSGGMLCIVVAVLIAFLYLLKRFSLNRGFHRNPEMIQMLASCHVAPRERVVLLDVLGEKILLGVTPQTINCLALLPRSGDLCSPVPSSEKSFSAIFKAASGTTGHSAGCPSGNEGRSDLQDTIRNHD